MRSSLSVPITPNIALRESHFSLNPNFISLHYSSERIELQQQPVVTHKEGLNLSENVEPERAPAVIGRTCSGDVGGRQKARGGRQHAYLSLYAPGPVECAGTTC